MARNIKKGDLVMVITGNDKGKTGEVLKVLTKKDRVLVQGLNQVYKHLRPSRQNPQGGRIRKEMPIHISNVLPVDPETNQPTRVGYRTKEDGSKERYAKKSGASLGMVKKASK
ncbi:MAG: 50S ribosomal protein L24 [Phycisphaerae bacterium]